MIVAVWDAAFSVAVTMTDVFDGLPPAVALKLAVVALAGAVTDAGTVNPALLDDNPIVTGEAIEALVRATVHVLLAFAPSVDGLQFSEDRFTGAWS